MIFPIMMRSKEILTSIPLWTIILPKHFSSEVYQAMKHLKFGVTVPFLHHFLMQFSVKTHIDPRHFDDTEKIQFEGTPGNELVMCSDYRYTYATGHSK